MVWVIVAVVGVVVLAYVLSRLSNNEPGNDTPTVRPRADSYQPPAPVSKPVPSRLSATEVLARARDLRIRKAQWPAIWSELNPGGDPTLQQLLVDLRNDGLQFAPHDGLRRIEIAAESIATNVGADAVTVLKKVLVHADFLDKFK